MSLTTLPMGVSMGMVIQTRSTSDSKRFRASFGIVLRLALRLPVAFLIVTVFRLLLVLVMTINWSMPGVNAFEPRCHTGSVESTVILALGIASYSSCALSEDSLYCVGSVVDGPQFVRDSVAVISASVESVFAKRVFMCGLFMG